MKKIYCTEGANNYARWIKNHEIVNDPELADIIIFTGGEDVDPALYGAKIHPRTYFNTTRDAREKLIFEKMRNNQLAVGVCRGSQLICVLNGGKLVQHVTNHAIGHTHEIFPSAESGEEKTYDITSTHHQMQYPFELEHATILYYSKPLSNRYEGDLIDPDNVIYEPEIVLYETPGKPKCLAIQGHPEMMRNEAPVIEYLNKLIDKYSNEN